MKVAADAIEKHIQHGERVLAMDLRGMGETAPGAPPKGRPNFFGVDIKEAFLGLHLNRPLLGQRLDDLLCILHSRPEKDAHLVGVESAGPIALHAVFLEPRIRKLTLVRSLVSWSNVVENPMSHNQLANVVPGVLEHYDLPYLEATLATAGFPLTVHELVDCRQRPVSK
jgi:hypothetical protein